MKKPITSECYEHIDDEDYKPLPVRYVLYIMEIRTSCLRSGLDITRCIIRY